MLEIEMHMKTILSLFVILSALTLVSCKQDDGGENPPTEQIADGQTPAPGSSPTAATPKEAEIANKKEELQNQCLADICGSASDYLATRVQGPFGKSIPQDVKTFLDTDVKMRLEKISQLAAKSLELKLEFLDQEISNFRPSDFSQEEFGLLLMKTLVPIINSDAPQAMGLQQNFEFIDITKIPASITQMHPRLFSQAVVFFNTAARTRYLVDLVNMPKSYDKYKSYIVRGLSQNWEKHLELRHQQIAAIKKEFNAAVFFDIDLDILKLALTDQLNDAQKNNFIKLIERTMVYSSLQDSTVKKIAKEFNTEDLATVLQIVQWNQRSINLHENLKKAVNSKKISSELFSKCNEGIVQAIAVVPSDLKLKRAQQLLDGVKVAAKAATKEYFQGDTLLKAQDAVEKIKFEIPKKPDDLKGSILSSLDFVIAQWERSQQIQDLDNNARKALALMYLEGRLYRAEEAILKSVSGSCDAFTPKLFEDHATRTSHVVLGWQSLSFHQIGAGIIAHEIGHIVSYAVDSASDIKSSDYYNARQCSTQMHVTNSKNNGLSTDGAGRFASEDWADSFSSTTLKILNKTWPYAKNFGCALSALSATGKFSGNSVLDQDPTEVHSTGMYRALQVHVGMGNKLPDSCKSALGDTDFQTMTRSCAK